MAVEVTVEFFLVYTQWWSLEAIEMVAKCPRLLVNLGGKITQQVNEVLGQNVTVLVTLHQRRYGIVQVSCGLTEVPGGSSDCSQVLWY